MKSSSFSFWAVGGSDTEDKALTFDSSERTRGGGPIRILPLPRSNRNKDFQLCGCTNLSPSLVIVRVR